jgi:hypothetical protein
MNNGETISANIVTVKNLTANGNTRQLSLATNNRKTRSLKAPSGRDVPTDNLNFFKSAFIGAVNV